jgi:hypothetical protein
LLPRTLLEGKMKQITPFTPCLVCLKRISRAVSSIRTHNYMYEASMPQDVFLNVVKQKLLLEIMSSVLEGERPKVAKVV